MKITRVLWHESGSDAWCPNGVSCEATYQTDEGRLRVLKHHRLVSADRAAAHGVKLAEDEFAVLTPDEMDPSANSWRGWRFRFWRALIGRPVLERRSA